MDRAHYEALVKQKVESLEAQATECDNRATQYIEQAKALRAEATAEVARFHQSEGKPCGGCKDKKVPKKK